MNQRDPLTFNMIVNSAISVYQLRETIHSKLPEEIRGKKGAQLLMSLKKRSLEDGKYLFETLYELFNMEEHD